jgi:DNA polymerase I-like protein with 3'-5' exonuclease and polymerase domains
MASLREQIPRFYDLELEAALILQKQEERGFYFDESAAWALTSTLEEELRQISGVLQQRHPFVAGPSFTPSRPNKTRGYIAGAPFTRLIELNISSRDHIAWVLQNHYGWKPEKKTTTGKPVIDETVLASLSYPIAAQFARVLTIKKILGMMSQGVNAWLKLSTKSRIHHHCSTATNTFRCAHRKPNLAQIPSDPQYRALFIPTPGMDLVGADLSGIELRCLAHFLARYDGGRYAQVLLNDDIHQVNADKIGISRKQVKTVTYAMLYGASNSRIGKAFDSQLSKNKASEKGAEIRAAYVEAIPGLDKLLSAVELASERGYVTAIDGRRILVDSGHKALNYLLQGTAAVIAKRWMVIADQNIKQLGIEAHQLAFVHDELQYETNPPNVETLCTSLVYSARESGEYYNFRVPIDAEANHGSSWAETH